MALVESGILFALPLGGLLYFRGALPMQDYLYFMVMSMVFLSGLLNLMNFAMMFSQIMSGVGRIQTIMDLPCTTEGTETLFGRQTEELHNSTKFVPIFKQ